jgi:ribosomal protein RSM22 (predicted rRNA methylase)
VPRSREHRLAKGGASPFEDEKYSYVVATRPGVAVITYAARVLAPPRSSKAGVELKLCSHDGTIDEPFVGKRDAAAFASVRRAWWGDALPQSTNEKGG